MFMSSIMRGCTVVAAATTLMLVGCGGSKTDAKDPSSTDGDTDGDTADGDNTDGDTADGDGERKAEVGFMAPELKVSAVSGDGPTSLADAKGKVVIVDFWATFCEPCKKSFPKYQEIVDANGGDVVLIAISVDDPDETEAEDIKKFAEELGVSFPIVWDKEQTTAGIYKPGSMPTSYIIDKEGKVRHIHGGYTADEASKISEEVAELLK